MSRSSAIAGSRIRVDSSRTSIATRRLPGREGGQSAGRRGAIRRERSVGARRTHLVMDLARGTAHGDGEGTAELNHDLEGNPFGRQIPPSGSGISYTFKVYQVNR